MRRFVVVLPILFLATLSYGQGIRKIRLLSVPGTTNSSPKSWKNSMEVSGENLLFFCAKCSPLKTVTIPGTQIASLSYGQNAYHHWVSGVVTGFFSLGIGAIVGLMPHHQHFFSVDLANGRVVAMQADKSNYKEIAGALENVSGKPIEVSPKDAHFLDGFNTRVVAETATAQK